VVSEEVLDGRLNGCLATLGESARKSREADHRQENGSSDCRSCRRR
jgi:hypothetical protein